MDIDDTQLLANPLPVKEINCTSVTIEELRSFSTKLNFRNEKDLSVMHGFCFWFDVTFEGSDTTITLSTSPAQPKTHWKQTVICFADIFTLKPSDPIECAVTFSVDKDNARRYDLTLEMGAMLGNEEYDSDTDNHEVDCSCMSCAVMRAYIQQQMASEETLPTQ